jgi:hypothetical protein
MFCRAAFLSRPQVEIQPVKHYMVVLFRSREVYNLDVARPASESCAQTDRWLLLPLKIPIEVV